MCRVCCTVASRRWQDGLDATLQQRPQFHPYAGGSPHHSPHRSRSPAAGAHSPLRQASNSGHTLTVPQTLPIQLQNYIANQHQQQSTSPLSQSPLSASPTHSNHLLDSLIVTNNDVMLSGSSPVDQQQQQQHLGLLATTNNKPSLVQSSTNSPNLHHHHHHHNGPVQTTPSQLHHHQHQPQRASASNQIQPKIVISSDASSNSAAVMDMNCDDPDSTCSPNTSQQQQPQQSRMCSKNGGGVGGADKSQQVRDRDVCGQWCYVQRSPPPLLYKHTILLIRVWYSFSCVIRVQCVHVCVCSYSFMHFSITA